MVATVERGLLERLFWSMEIAGESPDISSTSGFCICRKNCRAYAESDSTYLRWPSAKMVSNASDDFPLPESPVKTIILLRGISTDTFFKLCVRAPFMTIFSFISLSLSIHKPSLGLPEGGSMSTILCLACMFNDEQSSEIRLADFFVERIRDE